MPESEKRKVPECHINLLNRTIAPVEPDVCLNYRASCFRAVHICTLKEAPEFVLSITGIVTTSLKVLATVPVLFTVHEAVW